MWLLVCGQRDALRLSFDLNQFQCKTFGGWRNEIEPFREHDRRICRRHTGEHQLVFWNRDDGLRHAIRKFGLEELLLVRRVLVDARNRLALDAGCKEL